MIDVDVFVAGVAFRDLIVTGLPHWPGPGEEVHAHDLLETWGGIANQARALASYGLSVALCTLLGDDPASERIVLELSRLGIDCGPSQRQPGWCLPTTIAFPADGERAMVTVERPGGPIVGSHIAPGSVAAPAVVVDLALPSQPWLTRARAAGATVLGSLGFDASGRWDLASVATEAVDVWVLNELEATSYARTPDPTAAARRLTRHVPTVVVTLGAAGLLAATAEGELARVAAPRVAATSTVGAGDTVVAALAFGHLLPGLGLPERLELAALLVAGALEAPKGTASYPTLAQLASHPARGQRIRDLVGRHRADGES